MGAPHNKERYGELWPQERIDAYLAEIEPLRSHVVLSGGWAWHFMSPVGHKELKHAHDHKDVDIFVKPEDVTLVITTLALNGFKKVNTVYDGLKNNSDFRRYEKNVEKFLKPSTPALRFRITIDFFVKKDLQVVEVNGWKIVDPKQLLTFYKDIHSSDNCFAVKAAEKLLKRGISPIGREELVQIPKE